MDVIIPGMRILNVKPGTSKYRLKGDDGVLIGDFKITYTPEDRTCTITVVKLGSTMASIDIL